MILLRGVNKTLRVGSRLWHMYKQITGLAIQIGADSIQRPQPDAFDLALFKQRQVLFGNPDGGCFHGDTLAQSFKTRQTTFRRLG